MYMSKYFVYFSATGNGDFVAEQLTPRGYEAVKVEMVKPMGKIGFFKILNYGFRAMTNKKEEIKPIEQQIGEEDKVIIGSPVWNDRLSTPINTVLSQLKLNKETTQFVLYPAGNKTKKAVKQLKKMGFAKEPVVVPNPLKYNDQARILLERIR